LVNACAQACASGKQGDAKSRPCTQEKQNQSLTVRDSGAGEAAPPAGAEPCKPDGLPPAPELERGAEAAGRGAGAVACACGAEAGVPGQPVVNRSPRPNARLPGVTNGSSV